MKRWLKVFILTLVMLTFAVGASFSAEKAKTTKKTNKVNPASIGYFGFITSGSDGCNAIAGGVLHGGQHPDNDPTKCKFSVVSLGGEPIHCLATAEGTPGGTPKFVILTKYEKPSGTTEAQVTFSGYEGNATAASVWNAAVACFGENVKR